MWLVVPETKRLTLEEMDVLFGSVGVAVAVSITPLLLGVRKLTSRTAGFATYGRDQPRDWP